MFDESLLFNIIYTPNTVVRFLPFIKTLLNKSNLSFRLVSNGCSLPERKFLKIFCSKEKRLEYLSYPSIAIEEHGKVLNYLQALDKNRKYFCFIDSDIFATDNFENFFDDLFKDERLTAIFSGAPVWLKKSELIAPDNLKFLAGYYHWNEDNLCHGSTYFAIYRNNILNKLIQDTAIGFEIHKFEYLPQDIQDILLKMNMKKVMYDTAKVLNLLINYKGFKSQYIDITDLIHIGSLSFHAKNQITKIENRKYPKSNSDNIFSNDNNILFEKREQFKNYFGDLISALQSKSSFPELPKIDDIEIKNNVERAIRELIPLYT